MFPVGEGVLSFLEISNYWSREIHRLPNRLNYLASLWARGGWVSFGAIPAILASNF